MDLRTLLDTLPGPTAPVDQAVEQVSDSLAALIEAWPDLCATHGDQCAERGTRLLMTLPPAVVAAIATHALHALNQPDESC